MAAYHQRWHGTRHVGDGEGSEPKLKTHRRTRLLTRMSDLSFTVLINRR